MKRTASYFLPLALVLAGIGQARADVFTGSIYQSGDSTNYGTNPPASALANPVIAAAYNPTVAAATGLTLDAQFQTTSINFGANGTNNSGGPNYNPAFFFNNPTFFNESNRFAHSSGNYGAGANLDNTYVLLKDTTFSVVKGDTYTFTVNHDDGAQLIVNGQTLFTSVGPVTGGTSTGLYTATTTGTVELDLSYGEVAGPPATLTLAVTATPEPATLTMAGCGLVAFAGYKLRRRKQVAA